MRLRCLLLVCWIYGSQTYPILMLLYIEALLEVMEACKTGQTSRCLSALYSARGNDRTCGLPLTEEFDALQTSCFKPLGPEGSGPFRTECRVDQVLHGAGGHCRRRRKILRTPLCGKGPTRSNADSRTVADRAPHAKSEPATSLPQPSCPTHVD